MRDYKELTDVDIKLILQSGSSIRVDNIDIKPYTLDEIKDYGYSKYMQSLQLISLTVDDFVDSVNDIEKKMILEAEKENLRTFDFYTTLGGEDFKQILLTALSILLRTDDIRFIDSNVLAIDFMKIGVLYEDEEGYVQTDSEKLENAVESELKLIHRDNFDEIVSVIKLQNYLMKPEESKRVDNPADEETRALMEHMKKMREKVEAKKRQQQESEEESDIDLADIVSAVCSKSNSINKLNIWDFTLYQVYDEYARLELIDNYIFSIKAMMAGAEKIDLRHWSSRL
ncbi:hypothetical protein PQE66_gp213 [Bacillus phage PBC2]|uniref:Uncharacterized protein n=1 Tax=Bacillus phage PBC2 TaxID=1675029 RepID=A0A218KCC3_9CAUD|nr:hypothetical protein PQE66_gp213 [Bacillus phage PBC2]AKQ08528.1 hypothetical protein PBC2_213 [Bacillus phage PBC2]